MASDVVRPAAGWFVALDGGIAALAAVSLSSATHDAIKRRVRSVPPRWAFGLLLIGTAAVHLAEAGAAYRIARTRGSQVPGRWALQTLAVGSPSLVALRRVTTPVTSPL